MPFVGETWQREDGAVEPWMPTGGAGVSPSRPEGLQQEMAALRQSFLRDRLVLQLDRIEEQLDAGWQIWLATGNNKPLGQALERGQNLLANEPMAEVQVLRQTMTTDLAGLANRQVLDLRETMQQLDGVIATIDQLPLLQERRIQAAPSRDDKQSVAGCGCADANGQSPSPRHRDWRRDLAIDSSHGSCSTSGSG